MSGRHCKEKQFGQKYRRRNLYFDISRCKRNSLSSKASQADSGVAESLESSLRRAKRRKESADFRYGGASSRPQRQASESARCPSCPVRSESRGTGSRHAADAYPTHASRTSRVRSDCRVAAAAPATPPEIPASTRAAT